VTTGYTDVPVVRGVSIDLFPSELVALLGSNGSGKTTVLRAVMGFLPAWEGQVLLGETDLTNRPVHERVKSGLSMVPAGRHVFAGLTVRDNLRLGGYLDWHRDQLQARMAEVFDLFPDLAERSQHLAGELSGGEQQMCAIGRALMCRPQVLLVDELSMGLAPVVVARLMPTLQRLRDEWGIPILFVEQDVQRAIELADRVYVLDRGEITLEGQSSVLEDDRRVIRAFLGV
jgi:branched-chain amino acid transport system ATP-binding protein